VRRLGGDTGAAPEAVFSVVFPPYTGATRVGTSVPVQATWASAWLSSRRTCGAGRIGVSEGGLVRSVETSARQPGTPPGVVLDLPSRGDAGMAGSGAQRPSGWWVLGLSRAVGNHGVRCRVEFGSFRGFVVRRAGRAGLVSDVSVRRRAETRPVNRGFGTGPATRRWVGARFAGACWVVVMVVTPSWHSVRSLWRPEYDADHGHQGPQKGLRCIAFRGFSAFARGVPVRRWLFGSTRVPSAGSSCFGGDTEARGSSISFEVKPFECRSPPNRPSSKSRHLGGETLTDVGRIRPIGC
jgi:hypothetical protein